jgi:hypothetical protein
MDDYDEIFGELYEKIKAGSYRGVSSVPTGCVSAALI